MKHQIFSLKYKGSSLSISSAYREKGKERILLLHGLGCNKENFQEIFSFEELNDYALLAIDLPGFGESSKENIFSYTLEEHSSIIWELLQELPPRPLHIIGHSMGGAVGLLLSEKILGFLKSFISLEGNLISQDCGLLSRKAANVSFSQFENKLLPLFKIQCKSLVEKKLFLSSDFPLAFYRSAQSLVAWSDSGNLLSIFNNLPCPKAYIYAEKNTPLDLIPMLSETETIWIPGSGHFMMEDNPIDLYKNISKFLIKNRV